jgi:tRNA(Ile)-lysidine synthase
MGIIERVRVRTALDDAHWLDAAAIARSAANLADADSALDWAASQLWRQTVQEKREAISFRPGDAPPEIVRRIVVKAIRKLASEGTSDLRGRELDQLLSALAGGKEATLRGVRCSGGVQWNFSAAPPRRY